MYVYVITNGWSGNSDCHVIVVAEDDMQALQLASDVYKAEGTKYPPRYYQIDRLIITHTLDATKPGAIVEVLD
jgi:hypothetical protein